MTKYILAWGVALFAVLAFSATPVSANETNKKLNELARKINDILKKEDQTEVACDVFSDTGGSLSSAGPLIQARLMKELEKLKVGTNSEANIRVTGEFYADEEENKDQLGVKLEVRLRTKKGKAIQTLNTSLGYKSNEDLVKILAMSVDLTDHTKATPQKRNEEIKYQKEKPPTYTEDNKVKVRKDSPFFIEVLAAPAGSDGEAFKPRAGSVDKGQTFVPLHKGEEYRIKICNSSKHEIAVTVTIDGVDAFEFFTPSKGKPGSYLLGPNSERVITGWKFSHKEDKAFLVGSIGDSAAAKLYKASNLIGTITLCIHPCWQGTKPPPEYEGSRDVGTEIGRSIPSKAVTVPRTIGPLLEAISIRYKK